MSLLSHFLKTLIHLLVFPIVGVFYGLKIIKGVLPGKILYALLSFFLLIIVVFLLSKIGINV